MFIHNRQRYWLNTQFSRFSAPILPAKPHTQLLFTFFWFFLSGRFFFSLFYFSPPSCGIFFNLEKKTNFQPWTGKVFLVLIPNVLFILLQDDRLIASFIHCALLWWESWFEGGKTFPWEKILRITERGRKNSIKSEESSRKSWKRSGSGRETMETVLRTFFSSSTRTRSCIFFHFSFNVFTNAKVVPLNTCWLSFCRRNSFNNWLCGARWFQHWMVGGANNEAMFWAKWAF